MQVASLESNVSPPPSGHCIWYGECNREANGLKQNCPYDGPPKPLNNVNGTELLRKWCPMLDPNRVCCDTTQLESMNQGLLLPNSLLNRYVV